MKRGEVEVLRIGRAVWIGHRHEGLLIGAPEGAAEALGADRAVHLARIVLPSGRAADVGGLIGLLDAKAEHHPGGAVAIHWPLGDERVAHLLEAFERGWAGRLDLVANPEAIPARFETPVGRVRLYGAMTTDPALHLDVPQLAIRVEAPGLTIAVATAPVPLAAMAAAVRGADLAVAPIDDPRVLDVLSAASTWWEVPGHGARTRAD